jgi:cobalt/nickel transport system permease protein
MSKIDSAIYEIHDMDDMAAMDNPIAALHPLVKMFITIFYILIVVSFNPYQLSRMIPMIFYPVFVFAASGVGFFRGMKKLRVILPLVCLIGIINIFFDKTPVTMIGNVVVTGGVLSALTITLKGVLAVLASFLLIATTGIDKICYAMSMLHVPKIIVLQFSLTYRYITLLLEEANIIFQAYILRAPKQKGVHYKVWGPLVGQLLLRSMDRANALYDSMVLRGYKGAFYVGDKIKIRGIDMAYGLIWALVFLLIRNVNITQLLGGVII